MAIASENITSGMGTAAFVAFLMSLCNQRFSATQFALLSAFASVGRVWVGPLAGVLAQSIGWPAFFLVSIVVALPALALLLVLRAADRHAGARSERRRRRVTEPRLHRCAVCRSRRELRRRARPAPLRFALAGAGCARPLVAGAGAGARGRRRRPAVDARQARVRPSRSSRRRAQQYLSAAAPGRRAAQRSRRPTIRSCVRLRCIAAADHSVHRRVEPARARSGSWEVNLIGSNADQRLLHAGRQDRVLLRHPRAAASSATTRSRW